MNCGWCWQIEHEEVIHRGYVYSSGWISDDEARQEFLAANPRVNPEKTRIVKFSSGRYRRSWVGNVVAVGNSAGFVEPLESTALQVICIEASTLADSLAAVGNRCGLLAVFGKAPSLRHADAPVIAWSRIGTGLEVDPDLG